VEDRPGLSRSDTTGTWQLHTEACALPLDTPTVETEFVLTLSETDKRGADRSQTPCQMRT